MMFKKILTVSLASLLLLSLFSCDGSYSTNNQTENSKTEALHSLLNNSNECEDWYFVITNEDADEAVLSTAASKVASINNSDEYAKNLAEAILNNPQVTTNVAKKLLDSKYYPVWNEVAKWQNADEEVLSAAASKAASIDNSDEWAKNLAETILNNPQATTTIAKKLLDSKYWPVWNEVAKWQGTDEKTLDAVVKKVFSIKTDSNYYWTNEIITNIVNYHNEYAEVILTQVAHESANISNWIMGNLNASLDEAELAAKEHKAKRLAYSIVNSPRATPAIVNILMDSDFESVRSMATESLQNLLK